MGLWPACVLASGLSALEVPETFASSSLASPPPACLPTLGGGDKRHRASCTPTIHSPVLLLVSLPRQARGYSLPAVESRRVTALFGPPRRASAVGKAGERGCSRRECCLLGSLRNGSIPPQPGCLAPHNLSLAGYTRRCLRSKPPLCPSLLATQLGSQLGLPPRQQGEARSYRALHIPA